jgi:hypothetical protein
VLRLTDQDIAKDEIDERKKAEQASSHKHEISRLCLE